MSQTKLTANGKKALALTRSLLLARRNNNVKREQTAYDKLMAWCNENNFGFNQVLTDATAAIQNAEKNPNYIADAFNGITTKNL